MLNNEMRNKKIAYCQNNSKINMKIIERGKIDALNTQIHHHSLSSLGTGTSIKRGCVKLFYGPKPPLLVK